jgi:hypothetical protein
VKEQRLLSRPFDGASASFVGEEQVLLSDVPNGPSWSASQSGVLAYLRAETQERRLSWYRRDGTPMAPLVAEALRNMNPRLSPDERYVGFQDERGVKVFEFERGVTTDLSMAERGQRAIWSADGRRVFIDVVRDGKRTVVERAADGRPGETVRLQWDWTQPAGLLDVAKSGLSLLLEPKETVLVTPDGRRVPFSAERLLTGSFSPDGRWVVSSLRVGQRREVVALPVPPEAGGIPNASRVQISVAGGVQPMWSRNGREIFYVAPDRKMMAVPVDVVGVALRPGAPQALFDTRMTGTDDRNYDVATDGQRFLIAQAPPAGSQAQVSVIVNWPRLLR